MQKTNEINFNNWFTAFCNEHKISEEKSITIKFTPYYKYGNFKRQKKTFYVFEDLWITKHKIIKSKIISILGKSERIYARNCNVKKINKPIAEKFLNENHLYGSTKMKYGMGLFYDNELIAASTYAAQRKFGDIKSAEMLRFCNKNNITVIGGLSKLIKSYSEIYKPNNIMTYVDADWGGGEAFKKIGFTEVERRENIKFLCHKETGIRYSEKQFNDFVNIQKYEQILNSGSIKYILKI